MLAPRQRVSFVSSMFAPSRHLAAHSKALLDPGERRRNTSLHIEHRR